MWLAFIAIAVGLAILVWSADTFIDGATDLALRFNMPSFLVGVLILGVGTSAPEMVVSALSALEGSPGLALGNAYGSNIINITLVLGVTAFISPIVVPSLVVKQDMALLLLITALAAWQLSDGSLSFTDGVVLMAALISVLIVQIYTSIRNNNNVKLEQSSQINIVKALFLLVLGLSLLIASSRAIVWGAIEVARFWGVSELIIGLTIIAVGTSLPELVASIAAAKRGENEMALGNIIGSNLFNTLAVVGLAALISPMAVEPQILNRDMLMVAIATALLLILSLVAIKKHSQLNRPSGIVLIATFIGYSVWLALTSVA